MLSYRTVTRRTAAALGAVSAFAVVAPGASSAATPSYPAPTVHVSVEGDDVITTVVDNGGGDYDGDYVNCVNAGIPAADALALATGDPLALEPGSAIPALAWLSQEGTLGNGGAVTVDANTVLQNQAEDAGHLAGGPYASIGACMVIDPFSPGFMRLVSVGFAPALVPSGVGSLGAAGQLAADLVQAGSNSDVLSTIMGAASGS